MSAAGRFALGVVAGALILPILGLIPSGDAEEPATTTSVPTTEAPATVPWFEPEEVAIGATFLLPRNLNVTDGFAYLDYELTGIAPSVVGDFEDRPAGAGDFAAMPERWELTTASGAIVEATTGPRASSVRFEMPIGEEEVESIRLVGWRVAVPFGEQVEVPIESGATADLRRGRVTVNTVLEQSISTIVQLDFDRSGDDWDITVSLRPIDSSWRVTGRQGGGLQLIWEGTNVPESVVLEDAGFEMRPLVGEILVMEGVAT
ncbi:MAG: hypothetical protein QNJ75_01920 [Acidimicrobiia bacterium]|nr:hypothetical protein [Acidimicrobiia bacterium]